MTDFQIDKIQRFVDRLPPHLIDHWNEIADLLNQSVDESVISQMEMDNLQLQLKLIEQIKYWKILQLWIKQGKFTKQSGVINFAEVAISKIIPNDPES